MRSVLVALSGLATFALCGLSLVPLRPLIDSQSHLAAAVMVLWFVACSIAVGFVPMWVAARLGIR